MTEFVTRLQDALGSAYRIERELPLGGLGRVYLATEIASGRYVSVQALPPDLAARVDHGRFRAAVDKVARLRHPGILPLIAAGTKGDIVYCVWPHPRGESLRYRLIRDGGLGADDTVQVLHDVADALAYGHDQGVVHGDLKPDNIYLENGRALIAELGIRSALNAALGSEGGMDARADVHALSVAGQQMSAGRPGPVGAVINRALSIDPAEQYADAAAFREAVGAPPSARRRRVRTRLGAAAILILIAAGLVWNRSRTSLPLDQNLLAVAPFEILDPRHDVWREGLVTVLSANLDGAGPLHTVSPSVVIHNWDGRADAASAAALGRRTGARLVLYGRVIRGGGDSMMLAASLVDAESSAPLAEVSLADPDARLDRLADSLTVRLLRELSRTRPIGAVRSGSLGTSSLPALKAFLEGEQHYRRTEWDSALLNYQRAIELDSTFGLALYRAGLAVGWQSMSGDSLSTDYLKRAAAHNHGLSPRDSMLVVAESLTAALEDPETPGHWRFYRRLYATTLAATRRYPRDPEVWYEFGDVRYHWPAFATLQDMRDAFDRSIALDSAFAPAYIHPVVLASQLEDPAGAQHYLDRYMALHPKDAFADAMRLIQRLLDPAQARTPVVQSILDTASNDLILSTITSFDGWADSLETTIRLARLFSTSRASVTGADPELWKIWLGSSLAYHGHVREAWQRTDSIGWIAAHTAFLGGAPAELAKARFDRALRQQALYPRNAAAMAAPYFAKQRDSVALRDLARRADSMLRGSANPVQRAFGAYVGEGARALLALVRGDTAAAIRGLSVLSDTACTRCELYTVQLAELLDARKMDAEAARLLAHDSPGPERPTDGLWALFRARLATRQGDRRGAAKAYRFVRDVWIHADPVLQPYVKEAGDALLRRGERD